MQEIKAWILLLGVPAVIIALFLWLAPPQHNPFAPVDLAEPMGLGTWNKLTRAKKNPDICFASLDAVNVGYSRIDDSPIGERCGLYNALNLEQSMTPYSAPIRMTCGQMAALYTWERHVARPAAVEIFGSPIARIETYGTFSCRNIAGSSRLSQHANANAIDIAGVKLEDGRVITVLDHWDAGGKEEKFLKRLHSGACKVFSVSLGPNYNAAHKDHFHFDMGSGNVCS